MGNAQVILGNNLPARVESLLQSIRSDLEYSIVEKVRDTFLKNLKKMRKQLAGDGQPHDRIPGLEKYRILGSLGEGGQGTILLAVDDSFPRSVVIKRPLTDNPDVVHRFQQEALALYNAGQHNQAIMQIIDYNEHPACLVAEFIEGVTISALVKNANIMPAEAVVITMHLLKALGEAYAEGILHRDIKPGNVMFTNDGLLKVVDFGLAKDLSSNDDNTKTGVMMGTLPFMAPEVLRAGTKKADHRSDIYSVGILLHFLLTKHTPRKLDEWADAFQYACDASMPPIPKENYEQMPEPVKILLIKLTGRDPAKRPQTYNEALSLANQALIDLTCYK